MKFSFASKEDPSAVLRKMTIVSLNELFLSINYTFDEWFSGALHRIDSHCESVRSRRFLSFFQAGRSSNPASKRARPG